MLPGFEQHTANLTDYELNVLVPAFLNGFKTKIGVENAITNKQIVERMKGGYQLNDVVVRKIISYIREEGLLPGLVASSKGYYLTNDPKEIERYIESLHGRETKIRMVKMKMESYLKQLLTVNQIKIDYHV